jgi:demethylmenaquinone methyltransferase / 2-methoxy-6-polyprenyl-1,4-benzoquinol methylase
MEKLMDPIAAKDPQSIQSMFGKISTQYDLANSVLSFGIHHLWKKTLVRKSLAKPGYHILDCATGTGDLAFLFEKRIRGHGQVIGSDFCEPMLEVARQKVQDKHSKVKFEFQDVTNLTYPNDSFDIASISFGIRNVKDTQKALSELGRVVKPGGRVLVLEFGQPQSKIMATLFRFYSRFILPTLGGWISGQPQAYRYLETSSSIFPCGANFLEIAKATGKFKKLSYSTFQGGIAYLYELGR